MKILDRLKAKTPERDKKIGKLATAIGAGCGTALAVGTAIGFAFPPTALLLLTIGSIVLGGEAFRRGLKTEEDSKEEKN